MQRADIPAEEGENFRFVRMDDDERSDNNDGSEHHDNGGQNG